MLAWVISVVIVGGWVFYLLSGPRPNSKDDRLLELFHSQQFFIREPKTRWQRFLVMFFRDYEWARRMLGGVWEAYIHDMGTFHAIITWHWVEKPSQIKSLPLYRIEKFVNGRRQVVIAGGTL